MISSSPAFAGSESPIVEIQFNLCGQIDEFLEDLNLTKAESVERRTYLFETSSFEMMDSKHTIRLRIEGKTGELAVKKSNLSAAAFKEWSAAGADCEYDAHYNPKATSLSGTCKALRLLSSQELKNLLDNQTQVYQLFSSLQEQMISDKASLSRLQTLGPLKDRIWKFKENGFEKKISLEQSSVIRGPTFIEISTRTTVAKTNSVSENLLSLLETKNITLCADQSSQRRKKLQELFK